MDRKGQTQRYTPRASSYHPMPSTRNHSVDAYADPSNRRRTEEDPSLSRPLVSRYHDRHPNLGVQSVFSDRTPRLTMEHAITSDRRRRLLRPSRPYDDDAAAHRHHRRRLLLGPIENVARQAHAAGGLFVGGPTQSVWTTTVVPALAGEFDGLYLVDTSHPVQLRRTEDAITELIQRMRKYTATDRRLTPDDHRFFKAWERRTAGDHRETVRVINEFTDHVLRHARYDAHGSHPTTPMHNNIDDGRR